MRISIVTPAYNSEKFIAETIESVIDQKGDFEIDYIIVDGASTDGTLAVIKRYQALLSSQEYPVKCNGVVLRWISESDRGMYDAINKGFAMADGGVHAWINSDDVYMPGAFEAVTRTFAKYGEILWLKGITSYINEASLVYRTGQCYVYHQPWIRKGVYGRDVHFIQQDSVFWRSGLWQSAGGVDAHLRYAGDYSLWLSFAGAAQLYSLKVLVSCFRKQDMQLSGDGNRYRQEVLEECPSEAQFRGKMLRILFVTVLLGRTRLYFPVWIRKLVYRALFPDHNLRVVYCDRDMVPHLRTTAYCIA